MRDSPTTNADFRRRGLLLTAAMLAPLIACGSPLGKTRSAMTSPDLEQRFVGLERQYQARLGVSVLSATGSGIAYRADERFAFCSTFKMPLVAAVLHHNPLTHLDKVITYTNDDIRSFSPITQRNVQTGMTIGQLCEAAVRYSDGTAANLLLADVGGTAGFTGYLRSVGDHVSRLDQDEPELNRNPPGDTRDTTTPRALALDCQHLVLGDALNGAKREKLTDWMARSTTGAKRIRAGFPPDWKVIDKTGSGEYGRANDVAVVRSPAGVSHVVAILSDRASGGSDAEPSEALVAAAATCVAAALA